MRGRPPKYTPDLCEMVAAYLSTGQTLKAFAQDIGLSRRAVTYWRLWHPDFNDACSTKPASLESQPVPGVTLRQQTAEIFSLAAWGVPKDLALATPPNPRAMTEDEVDERLFGGQMRARAA